MLMHVNGAYDPTQWQVFFGAAAGAAATLSGLIFVGISINLRSILAEERKIGSAYLTGRGLESIVSLLVVIAVSFVALAPTASATVLAFSILFAALVGLVSPFRSVRAFVESKVKPTAFTLRLTLTLILVATYVVSGVTLLLGVGGGINWLPLTFILALSVASINAWVLTVEVSR